MDILYIIYFVKNISFLFQRIFHEPQDINIPSLRTLFSDWSQFPIFQIIHYDFHNCIPSWVTCFVHIALFADTTWVTKTSAKPRMKVTTSQLVLWSSFWVAVFCCKWVLHLIRSLSDCDPGLILCPCLLGLDVLLILNLTYLADLSHRMKLMFIGDFILGTKNDNPLQYKATETMHWNNIPHIALNKMKPNISIN